MCVYSPRDEIGQRDAIFRGDVSAVRALLDVVKLVAVVYHLRLRRPRGGNSISTGGAAGCAGIGCADRGVRGSTPVLLNAIGVARNEGARAF